MRISECADLTGTTVRTIRYYHQIGLLPVPDHTGGRRDYALEHVARILRIRWLADAGLPLEAIADLLGEEEPGEPTTASLRDLYPTAAGIDERIAEMQEQRRRIGALIEMAEAGQELTALPASWHRFYDRLAASVSDPEALKVLRREQRLAEMFAQRGLVPVAAEALIAQLDDDDMDLIVSFYTRFAHLGELPPEQAESVSDDLVHDMTSWCRSHLELSRQFLYILPPWARHRRSLQTLLNFATLLSTDRRQAAVLRRILPVITEILDADTTNPHDTSKGVTP